MVVSALNETPVYRPLRTRPTGDYTLHTTGTESTHDRGKPGAARVSFLARTVWSAAARQKDLTRNHEPLDLRSPLVDLEELRVAHQLLDRILLHVAVAAEDLDGVGGDFHHRVGREPLRKGRVERRAASSPIVEHPRGLPDEQARGLDLGRHVGDHEIDRL